MKNILLIILGFFAWLVISISDDMLKSGFPLAISDLTYAGVLVLSVVYFHWLLRRFLLPLEVLPENVIEKVRDFYQLQYSRSFLAGTIGLGYLLLFMHVVTLMLRNLPDRSSSLAAAIFFIALGTLAQTRAVVQYFCQGAAIQKKVLVEPPAAERNVDRPASEP